MRPQAAAICPKAAVVIALLEEDAKSGVDDAGDLLVRSRVPSACTVHAAIVGGKGSWPRTSAQQPGEQVRDDVSQHARRDARGVVGAAT